MTHTTGGERQRVSLQLLTENEIERVHQVSLGMLDHTGIVVHYPPARELLRAHGAEVDEARQRVRIPHRLVEQALQTAPRRVTIFSMDDETKDCLLGVDGGHYARPSTGLNWILDYRAVKRRPVTEQDTVNWARVAHAMPNIHFGASLYDQESATRSMEVRSLVRILHHTDKPLMFSALSGEGMRWLQRLSEVTQPPRRQPRLMVLSSVNSPLVYSWGQCEAAMVSAELGIPVAFNSSAVAGATAPVTLAGAVAQINAEMLAALTIIQLHRPGAPVVYAAHPMAMDMKTGMASISMAEVGLMSAACVQIGRHYGLPTSSNGVATDVPSIDPMAMIEKWACGYPPALAGANVNAGAGSLNCVGTVSLEQLVIDNDLYGCIFRHLRGFEVNDESLAADLIARVGLNGSFMLEEHTLAHYKSEYYYPKLARRISAPVWEAAGSIDALQRAADMVRDILSAPLQPVISEDQSRELHTILVRAEATLANIEVPI